MNLISRIILFAAAALLFPALYGAGERELAVQFAKHEDFSSAAADEVRELYRHVQQVYRLRGKPAVRNCRVMLTKAAPPGEIVVTQKRDYWLIEFDHTADWQRTMMNPSARIFRRHYLRWRRISEMEGIRRRSCCRWRLRIPIWSRFLICIQWRVWRCAVRRGGSDATGSASPMPWR